MTLISANRRNILEFSSLEIKEQQLTLTKGTGRLLTLDKGCTQMSGSSVKRAGHGVAPSDPVREVTRFTQFYDV